MNAWYDSRSSFVQDESGIAPTSAAIFRRTLKHPQQKGPPFHHQPDKSTYRVSPRSQKQVGSALRAIRPLAVPDILPAMP